MDELLTANRHGMRETLGRAKFRLLVLLGIGLVMVGINGFERMDRRFGIYLIVLGVFFILLFSRPLLNLLLRRQFSKRPDRELEILFEASEDGMKWTTANSQTTYDWSMISKGRRNKDGFLLFQNPQIFHWLPNHAFASESVIKAFAELLESKLNDYKEIGVSESAAPSV